MRKRLLRKGVYSASGTGICPEDEESGSYFASRCFRSDIKRTPLYSRLFRWAKEGVFL